MDIPNHLYDMILDFAMFSYDMDGFEFQYPEDFDKEDWIREGHSIIQ